MHTSECLPLALAQDSAASVALHLLLSICDLIHIDHGKKVVAQPRGVRRDWKMQDLKDSGIRHGSSGVM